MTFQRRVAEHDVQRYLLGNFVSDSFALLQNRLLNEDSEERWGSRVRETLITGPEERVGFLFYYYVFPFRCAHNLTQLSHWC